MTDEINNINTDLKELFSENKLEELIEKLETLQEEIVLEITNHNYEIIKKYYDTEKFNLILQYIRFVAFSSFLCEYSYKSGIVTKEDYEGMYQTFEGIYKHLQNNK